VGGCLPSGDSANAGASSNEEIAAVRPP
jgi:hypothetical protein